MQPSQYTYYNKATSDEMKNTGAALLLAFPPWQESERKWISSEFYIKEDHQNPSIQFQFDGLH